MKYIIRHQFRNINIIGLDFYVTNFFQKFYNELKEKYPQHEFEISLDPEYEKYGQGGVYSCMSLSLINPNNDNYVLISFFDNWKYHFMSHLGWNGNNMKKFFYAGGFNYLDYFNFKQTKNDDLRFPENIEMVYEPFFYNPYFDCCYGKMTELFENRNPKHDKLFFRGWMWDSRKNMTENINRDDILIIDKNVGEGNLNYIEYLNELSEYKVSLSLPGGTEICNRDIESFAIGIPVLRPSLSVNYPNPLIPNYHYISFFHHCDYIDMGNPKYLDYRAFQKNLEYTWELVKNNDEYLNFVSKNARNWFLNNCSIDKNIDLILNKIDLEIL
jgi:hypothetical protein